MTRSRAPAWLFSGPVDLALIANLGWPLVAVIGTASWSVEPLTFLQFYVLSAAHRWITFPLVLLDRERVPAQATRFAAAALAAAVITGLGLLLALAIPHPDAPGDLLVYLVMVDYVWNAWDASPRERP